MSVAKRVFKNTIFLYSADLIARFASAILTIFIARRLGSEDLGRFSYVYSVIAILSTISTFGLNTYLVRQASKENEERQEKFYSEVYSLRLVINTLVTILLVVYAQFFVDDPVVRILFHLTNISTLLAVYHTHWALVSRIREKMEFEAIVNIVASVIYGAVGIFLLYANQGIVSIAILSLVLILFRSILFARYAKETLKLHLHFIFNFDTYKELLKDAMPFGLMVIIYVIYFRIDVVFIEHYLGITEVGYYSAAYRIMELLLAVPGILSTAMLPIISKKIEDDPGLILKSSLQSLKLLNMIGFPLVVGGFLYARAGISLLYGDGFQSSVLVFQVLVWTLIPLFNSAITATIINASKKPVMNTYFASVNLVVNVVLNLILIPKIGIVGAAIATFANETAGFILAYLYINRTIFKFPFYANFGKIILATVIMGGFIILGQAKLYLIPFAIIIYFATIYLFKFFDDTDYQLIQKILPDQFKFKGKS